jgi:eukaryotic-like serine/threonine-protein kinase
VTPDPWLGKRVGAYELIALLGRGGMGSVYRARRVDAEYEREVAIKLVPGAHEASYVLQRLRSERQILATLDHPNIARLIDGGATEDGLAWLVMELVEGEPLDAYCEARHLRLRERLHLFRAVCAAVSYAHQRLVIHRDLKPDNVLVTADGSVKLLDFGIAKLMQPTVGETTTPPTVTLMRALTPGFSSPEQLLGKTITTSSDVYSLGVMLYVLLTGRSPYGTRPNTAPEAIRMVSETEPARPSTIARLDRDLDAITLRALRKEPEKRYRSVDELSGDIGRYLAGRPVLARGDEWSYHAVKFLRRRRLEIAAAGLVALTLVGGVVVSLRQAGLAQEQRASAEAQRQRAERHFARVRKLADVFMFQVHDAIEKLPGSVAARELLVRTSLDYLNTLSKEAGEDRGLQQELASAWEKVADIQGEPYGFNKGEPRPALESYARAIALLTPIVAADPGNRPARAALARNEVQRSHLLLLLGEPGKSIESSQKAIALFEALAAEQPDDLTRQGLAKAYRVHAYNIDMGAEDQDAGMAYAAKAVAILEELTRRKPDDLELLDQLNGAYSSAASVLQGDQPDPKRLQQGLDLHRKALAISERLIAETGNGNVVYVRSFVADLINVGDLLSAMGDFEGVLEVLAKAGPPMAVLTADQSNSQAHFDATFISWHRGRALLETGRLTESEQEFGRAYDALTEIARTSDTLRVQYLLGSTAWGLGEASLRRQRWSDAKRWFEKAMPHFDKVTAGVNLDHTDRQPIEDTLAGLERSKMELAREGT